MAKYKIIPSSRTIVQSPISIGHKAEKGVEAIEFDLTAWVETYGSGTATIIMKRWGDEVPYPVALEIGEDNKATWTLSDMDTAKAGMAYAQLSYIVGDEVVKKSDIYTFRVMDSLTGEGEPPEAYESWLENLTHIAAKAMAEVLDIEGIVTDKTLTVDGGIADGKATGDALALKADKSTTYTKSEVDTLIKSVNVETDTTLSVSGKAADSKTVGDAISEINESLGDVRADLDNKVDFTGENQVTPQNIEGMQFTKTTTEVEGENIFDPATMVYAEGKYVYVDNKGQINYVTDSYFNAYVIPVVQNSKYVFPQARFAALGKGNERYYEAVGTTIDYATQVDTDEATYLFLSYPSTTSASSITVKKVIEVNTYSDFILPEWMQPNIDISGKVDKDGVGQVTPQNIKGMTLDSTRASANLFPTATLVAKDKYVGGINSDTGKVSLYTNNGMDTYIIPVDGESTYTFTYARTACVVADLEYTPVGSILSNVREIDSTGGSYILFSFTIASYPVSTYTVTKPVTYYEIPSNWIIPQEGVNKKPIDSVKGAISASGSLEIVGRSAIKDGQMIAFKGKFSSFSGFTLNFFGTVVTNYIAVTGSTIAINNTTPTPVNHGLTIQNEVTLTVEFIEGNAKISLYSMGNLYTQTVSWNQLGGTVTQPQIVSNGTEFTNAILTVAYDCANRDIWYFGDSYTGSSSPARWCYYLKENGYMGNLLINGSAGATSGGALISYNALLKYGTPKIAVLATGMNDGSDSTTPPSNYVTRRTEFLSLCESNGIEPVFCTIPTVPSVNNEQKNAWVRSSGYRYIDFASAVGADGTGTWYSGMLSGDNVHPTANGAKALYTQVLIDLPEITISN